MSKNVNFLILVLIFCGCSENNYSESAVERANYFHRASKVEVFGDSLRIEYEYNGDTIVEHRIDLKGIEDDGFDDSYNITSIMSQRNSSRLECESKIRFRYNNLEIFFCTSEVIKKYNEFIEETGPWRGGMKDSSNLFNERIIELKKIKSELEDIENEQLGELKRDSSVIKFENLYLPFELAIDLPFEAMNVKTSEKIQKFLIQKYTTEFSGGKIYYMTNNVSDTIFTLHNLEYMR